MKVTFQLSEKMNVQLDVETQRALFEQLGDLQDVFGESQCGACGCTDVRFQVREVDENKYYELVCPKCRAKKAFGCHKNGKTLFPKRKDAAGAYLPNNGWTKWDGKKAVQKTEAAPQLEGTVSFK